MRENLDDLVALIAIAKERSFTRAAAQLGVSQSALSHTIRGLEGRLGVRLLTRTTRSVATTEAGEMLLTNIGPRLEEIGHALDDVVELRKRPAGTIRITAAEHPVQSLLWPRVLQILPTYPDIKIEVCVDSGLTDIAAQRFDAGVRLGEQVAKDMVAVRIGPNIRFAVVGAPSYFSRHAAPREPQDLVDHNCINLRFPTHGNLFAWEFQKAGRELHVKVEGQLVTNTLRQRIDAALAGMGLAYVPEDTVIEHMAKGRLTRVLEEWCAPLLGYHLYYPSRRQATPAFAVLIEALRYREPPTGRGRRGGR